MAKKSWAEKMLSGGEPEVKVMEKDVSWVKKGTKMVIVNPRVVAEKIRGVRYGEAISVAELRDGLAEDFGADMACPMSTGIFVRIVSEAAWEEIQGGKGLDEVVPFWRVVEPGSKLAKKLACGDEWLVGVRGGEGIDG